MPKLARPLAAFVVLALIACGPTAREKALHGSLLSVTVAADGFNTWTDQREGAIIDAEVARHATEAEGRAELADFRADVDRVSALVRVSFRAIAVAALDDKTPISVVVDTVGNLIKAIADLKGATP